MDDLLFQFTPLREGRPDEKCGNRTEEVFQFTPLREGRQPHMRYTCLKKISIHAPPRGATRGQEETDEPHQHFNSRPSARGDVLPPRNPLAAPHFNSRPSARGDAGRIHPRQTVHISIHAPPRGATIATMALSRCTAFQFTPLREGRRKFLLHPLAGQISIHAPPRGATRRK